MNNIQTIFNQRKIYFAVSMIIFLLFVGFSYLVAKELFNQIDFDLTVKFQDRISHRFDEPFSYLSVLGSAEVSLTFWLLLTIFLAIRRFWLAFFSMSLLPLALVIEIFGKLYLYHPGPPFLFYRGVVDIQFPSHHIVTEYSYPSGHMLRTTFLASFLLIYILLRTKQKYRLIALPFTVLFLIAMMVSRIYLGEHWTTDVIGGFLLGLSTGIFAGACLPSKSK